MFKIVKTYDDIKDLVSWFESNQNKEVSLDTETSSVDVYNPTFKVRTIQFGTSSDAWFMEFPQWRGIIEHIMKAHTGGWLIHNSSFDVSALSTQGIHVPWHLIKDTMLALRIAEPHRPAGLKDAASRHVSRAAANGQKDLHEAMRKQGWGWDTIPTDFPAYQFYGAMDCILTSRLAETAICKSGFNSSIFCLEMDYRALCSSLEKNGMRFDIGRCQDAKDRFAEEIVELNNSSKDKYGISLTSNGQLGHWLIEHKAPMTKATAGGGVSVDLDSLTSARESLTPGQTEIAEVIDSALRIRKLTKLSSAYLDNILEMHTGGLIHPSINTLAARTGRSSVSKPALQTLPRSNEDPDSAIIRQAVIPRNEGELLISSDMEQVELREIANLSKDPGLVEAFRVADETGVDFFTSSGKLVYDDPNFSKSDPRRTGIKVNFYSASFGAGVNKMATTAGMPLEEMRELSSKVFGRFPGIKLLMKKCELTARENDWWITTPFGRKIYVDPDRPYSAMNSLIQSHCGELFKKSMVDIGQAGLTDQMVMVVHDELLLSVPKEDIEEARHIVRESMCYTDMAVPLLAEPSEGCSNWADAK